jgi:hypothetical protein
MSEIHLRGRARRALARSGAQGAAPPAQQRRDGLPRVAFTIAETAGMLGKNATALRRECERKARREGDQVVADLALGIRAHKHGRRWFVTVPRELLA